VLRKILGPKREEVRGYLKTLHIEELHGLFSPPNIIRVIKSSRIKWTRYVESREKTEGVQGFHGETCKKMTCGIKAEIRG
jgi:hypothetical protein